MAEDVSHRYITQLIIGAQLLPINNRYYLHFEFQ